MQSPGSINSECLYLFAGCFADFEFERKDHLLERWIAFRVFQNGKNYFSGAFTYSGNILSDGSNTLLHSKI